MRLPELRSLLRKLEGKGYIPSTRAGPTGIGHTLERQLGITENNLPIPDLGGVFEVKATRAHTNNLITLFTLDRGAWQFTAKEIVEDWGYIDENGRPSLFTTVSALAENSLGLQLSVPEGDSYLSLRYVPDDDLLGSWDMEQIVETFESKLGNMLFVHADSQHDAGREMFHFNRAHLLTRPDTTTFEESFTKGVVTIDIRMYIRPNGTVRNHGTGFRISEQDLPKLFRRVRRLL